MAKKNETEPQVGSESAKKTGTGSLTIIRKQVSELHFDPRNARKHGERNLATIRKSLSEFGQVEPLIVQKGTGKVIAGNGRLEVLIAEGATEVDCVEVDVTDKRASALGIALNRTAELAEWDDEVLAAQLRELLDDDAEAFASTGFDEDDLSELLDESDEPSSPDDFPEVGEDIETDHECPKCGYKWSGGA